MLWYASRVLDRSDEPWGLISLATAAIFLFQDRVHRPEESGVKNAKLNGSLAVVSYIVLFPFAPNLVLGFLLIAALWFILSGDRPQTGRAGIFGLVLISLPLIPSLNFYGGYPMRLVTAAGTQLLLACLGMSVSQQGTMLTVQNMLIAIDAPCSGISMLWASTYISLLMATIFKLSVKKTLLLVLATGGFVITANVLRAASLVMYDTIAGHQAAIASAMPEPIVHVGVGLLVFVFSSVSIILLALKLQKLEAPQNKAPQKTSLTIVPSAAGLKLRFLADRLFIPACLIAACMPLLTHSGRNVTAQYSPPRWPTKIAGHTLMAMALLPDEDAFSKEFPGAMKRFNDGSTAFIVRAVNRETRQLHPSSDCFRGLGYSITFRPLVVDQESNQWNAFVAVKDGLALLVMERVYDEQGKSWTDVSSWYWAAALGQTKGPWWAITMVRPATAAEAQSALEEEPTAEPLAHPLHSPRS
ncbi:MAG: archaeosortase/exosortase family protein [Cyanobacteria bacterium SZAS TMP-1]|nr:archaeosortase/exosortase family protein [Cyanobacteria bacterium SZAS TMP-1]